MRYFNLPVIVNFEITNRCNANCIFCSIKDSKNRFDFAPFDRIRYIIDRFHQHGILRINFFGGEPFIHPHIAESIQYAKEKEFYVSAVSNGLAINQNLCEKIKGCVDVIGISLHGMPDTHDKLSGVKHSFQRVSHAIGCLLNAGLSTGINFTMTTENYTEIEKLIVHLRDELKHRISFAALNRYICSESDPVKKRGNCNLGLSPDQLEKTLYSLKRLKDRYDDMDFKYAISFPRCLIKEKSLWKFMGRCWAGQNYCSVNINGDMKICSYSNTVLGNIFKESLVEIWKNSTVLKSYRSEEWMPKKCKECEYKNDCMTGCRMTNANKAYSADILLSQIQNTI